MTLRREDPPTDWSLVCALDDAVAPADRDAAWARLCARYRPAMVAFAASQLQRAGGPCGRQDAEDLVQAFLAQCHEKGWFRRADQDVGRFRVFVRVLLARFARDWVRREHAQKRRPPGGVLPLAEHEAVAPGDARDPAAQFEDAWSACAAAGALERVRRRSRVNAMVLEIAMREEGVDGPEMATRLGVGKQRASMMALRARRMFAEALWDEVKETAFGQEERADERRRLFHRLAPYMDARRSPSFFESQDTP